MTGKDFHTIAMLLNRWVPDKSQRALLFVEFAYTFVGLYPNFNKQKWHDAMEK